MTFLLNVVVGVLILCTLGMFGMLILVISHIEEL